MGAEMLGLLPDPYQASFDSRKQISESLAIYGSLAVERDGVDMLETTMQVFVQRNEDVRSAVLRKADGTILAEAGDRVLGKPGKQNMPSSTAEVRVPIFKDKMRWGTLEVRFEPIYPRGILGIWARPIVKLILFVIPLGFIGYLLFMKKTLRYLDPSLVIPKRVKATLDTLAEGVVVLDNQERIVLANSAFAEKVEQSDASLLGLRASELNWTPPNSEEHVEEFPWLQVMHEGQARTGIPLGLRTGGKGLRAFMVNGAPILDGEGNMRGAMATFDDITKVEEQNDYLQRIMKILRRSRDKVRSQNQELQVLATQDPLTRCLNRRAFFERFEAEFTRAQSDGDRLSCIMIDIDQFKSINDRYGHLIGDKVLQELADILRSALREKDVICRYGGEEFCILLPSTSLENAVKAAERFRASVESTPCSGVSTSASFGVSSLEPAMNNHQELLSRADKALYAAKNAGRNRVVYWGEEGCLLDHKDSESTATPASYCNEAAEHIPQHIVNALMLAMAHRDPGTAEHCRQVAKLCSATAEGLMSLRECFVLEAAAQLHDIGKLGVPDAILHKPGPLTEEELSVVHDRKRKSVEVVASIFLSPELTEIVRNHAAWYGGTLHHPDLPKGKNIPLGSRILSIADAFSSMTSERLYRSALDHEEAFKELRRCAGKQFDPGLVEHFIDVVRSRDQSRQNKPATASNATYMEIGCDTEKL
jgi:diguanylate cyclase (GGDEF)-like protein/PAS domain S-box-containing protein